jgi:O-acetyl-ADP-ribose deacetylase (regulator of RNase III)
MTTISGDILDVPEGVICHQVNCLGIMGGGLARQIRRAYPKVFDDYKHLCDLHGDESYNLLGEIQVIPVGTKKWIINLFAQYDIGGGRATEYGSFIQCLEGVEKWANKTGSLLWSRTDAKAKIPIFFPYKIGCGLGGGSWHIIKNILKNHVPSATLVRMD